MKDVSDHDIGTLLQNNIILMVVWHQSNNGGESSFTASLKVRELLIGIGSGNGKKNHIQIH